MFLTFLTRERFCNIYRLFNMYKRYKFQLQHEASLVRSPTNRRIYSCFVLLKELLYLIILQGRLSAFKGSITA